MLKAGVTIDRDYTIGEIDPRIYSSFVEHLGRAVHGGIWDSEAKSYREDVIALANELGIEAVRYPGGNFVSSYRWEDGVGPNRTARLDPAWRSLETNEFGTDEAAGWAEKCGADLIMAVNLGTRGPQDAVNLLEYCNLDTPAKYAQMRKGNGHEKPYGVKMWCLGNEMDGEWQTGHKTPSEYARIAAETARAMKRLDPSIELIACGSSNSKMKTFPEWELTVLSEAYDDIDYISMHQYYGNHDGDIQSFLASNLDLDRFISSVAAACDCARAMRRSGKKMFIALDEWNVWYHSNADDDKAMAETPWRIAPPLLEDIYTGADALVVGAMLITILRHADRVKIACLAQLVNVIAPIMVTGGKAWRQTIFFPFKDASTYGRGTSMDCRADSPFCSTEKYGDAPLLECAAALSEDGRTLALFALNRTLDNEMELSVDLRGFGEVKAVKQTELRCEDLMATNGPGEEKIRPRDVETDGRIVLRRASWNTILFSF